MINPATIKLAAGGIAIVSIFFFGVNIGSGLERNASDKKISELKLKHAEEISDREQTLMEIERQANEELAARQKQIDEANTKFAEDMNNAKREIDKLNACIKSGDCVLKPKVKACVSTSKTDNTGAVVTETRAELDSEVAANIVGVGGRCDDITRQLNALIDAVKSNAR